MSNLLKNKKASKLFSIWWFGVLVIIGGFIVLGVFMFYGSYVDARSFESEVLTNKVALCFSDGKVDFTSSKKEVLENCDLYKPLFEQGSKYFIMASFDYTDENLENPEPIKIGNNAFEEDCKISSKAEAKEFPKCSTKKFELNEMKITITTGSNAKGKSIG